MLKQARASDLNNRIQIYYEKMTRLFNRQAIKDLAKMQVARYGNKADHWVSALYYISQAL